MPSSERYATQASSHRSRSGQLGATRRLVPVSSGVLMVAFGVVGVGLIGYVPRLVVAAQPIGLSPALISEFEARTFATGSLVMAQGGESDGMFVLVDGWMTALRVDETGMRHRLRRFGRGAMVGEIGLITGGLRTAEIVAETDADVLWLSADRYRELRRVRPEWRSSCTNTSCVGRRHASCR